MKHYVELLHETKVLVKSVNGIELLSVKDIINTETQYRVWTDCGWKDITVDTSSAVSVDGYVNITVEGETTSDSVLLEYLTLDDRGKLVRCTDKNHYDGPDADRFIQFKPLTIQIGSKDVQAIKYKCYIEANTMMIGNWIIIDTIKE